MGFKTARDVLNEQADFELGRRSLSGAVGQIVLLAVLYMATQFHQRHASSATWLAAAIVSFNLFRWILALRQSHYYPGRWQMWCTCLWISMIGPALAWGWLFVMMLRIYGTASYQTAIVTLVGSGIAAAVTSSVSPRKNLARLIITFMIGLPLIQLLFVRSPQSIPMALIFVTYYVFLWQQIGFQHRAYWNTIMYRKNLSEEADRLWNILDAIPGLVSWIGTDLKIHGVNRNYARNYGAHPVEFAGQDVSFHNEDAELVGAVRAFVSSPEEQTAREIEIVSRSGGEETKRAQLLVMRKTNQLSPDETAKEVYSICIDIHGLREAEAKLEEERVKSEQTSKLAMLGEFTASIVHEIKTPLTSVVLASQLIRRNLDQPKLSTEKLQPLIDQAVSNTSRIITIIDSLTRFSRNAKEEPYHMVRLKNVIKDSVELTRAHFRNNQVSLYVDPVDDEVQVWCSPVEISQVLINLLTNALDAARNTRGKWVRLKAWSEKDSVVFSVVDSGSGIADEIRDKVFRPFFTTKPAGAGTGLGLSISKRIIERHGGRLELDRSAANTTFVVRLPANKAASMSA